MFSDTALNEDALYIIANRLYPNSYVSLESALSHYGLIPEGVYSISSVSTKKTSDFKTPIANFTYRRIRAEINFGYQLHEYGDQNYKIAEMEKAVLDYLYLHPKIVDNADFHEWRFNGAEFLAKANMAKLNDYAVAFKNIELTKRLKKLLKLIKTDN